MPGGFVTTRTIWDQRQNRTLTCTQINVGKLGDMDGNPATKDPCPYYPANGLLYVARTDATVRPAERRRAHERHRDQRPGQVEQQQLRRAVNPVYRGSPPVGAFPFGAPQLQGLTVVSPDPVYVHGNYNTQVEEAGRSDHRRDQPPELGLGLHEDLRPGEDRGRHDLQPRDDHGQHRTRRPATTTAGSRTSRGSTRTGRARPARSPGSFVSTWFSSLATGALGLRRRLVQRAEPHLELRHDVRPGQAAAVHADGDHDADRGLGGNAVVDGSPCTVPHHRGPDSQRRAQASSPPLAPRMRPTLRSRGAHAPKARRRARPGRTHRTLRYAVARAWMNE